MGGKISDSPLAASPRTSLWQNRVCFLYCFGFAISTFQYGADTGIINGFQAMQGFLRVFGYETPSGEYAIATTFQQLITSLLQLGLIIASFIVGPLSRYLGRTRGFFLASIISIVAILIQIFVTTKGPIYFARLLLGIGNGIYVNLSVLYISECSPAHLRGFFVSIFQPFVTFGGIFGAVINYGLKENYSKISYQAQLAILCAVPVWLLILPLFAPESPRWLLNHGREVDARRSLRRLRGKGYAEEYLEQEIVFILDAIKSERGRSHGAEFFDIFKGTDLRRTILCTICTCFHASSGINFIVGYGTYFYQQALPNSDPFILQTVTKCCGMVGAVTGVVITRYLGRRTILGSGFFNQTISMLLVAVLYTTQRTNQNANKAMVAFVCIYSASYSYSIGPSAWVTAAEMPSTRLRSMAFGMGMTIGFIFAWLTTFTGPYFLNPEHLGWGGKYAWIWCGSNLISLLFILFFLPETKDRPLEELDEMFQNHVPARKFKNYQCTENLGRRGDLDADDKKEDV